MTRFALFLMAGLILSGCAVVLPSYRNEDVRMTSLAAFDPAAYAGRWEEAARFPVPFQSDCVATAATYGAPVNGVATVENTCLTLDGEAKRITGTAEVVGPGRLKVRLKGVPFAADYWVLWADDTYQTAVVGVPSGRAGWILSRTLPIREDKLTAALDVLRFNGYDTDVLVFGAAGAP